jgi:HEAT repeat protein
MKNLIIIVTIISLILSCSKSEYERAKEIYQQSTFQKNYSKESSNIDDAIAKLESTLQREPDNIEAKILLWKCYLKSDNPKHHQLRNLLLAEKHKLLKPLLNHLDDRDEVVRQQIVSLIGELEDPNSVPTLIKILEKDEYHNVQRAAAEALGKLKDRQAILPLLSKLDSSYPLVRHYAVSALKNFNDTLIIQKLLVILANSEETIDIRHQAALSLGEIGNKIAIPDLLKIYQSPDQPVESKLLAVITLGMLSNPIGFDFAMEFTHSDQPYLIGLVLTALGHIKNSNGLPILIDYLKYGNKAQRAIAAEALGNLGDAQAISPLKQASSDPIQSVADAARKALNKLEPQ